MLLAKWRGQKVWELQREQEPVLQRLGLGGVLSQPHGTPSPPLRASGLGPGRTLPHPALASRPLSASPLPTSPLLRHWLLGYWWGDPRGPSVLHLTRYFRVCCSQDPPVALGAITLGSVSQMRKRSCTGVEWLAPGAHVKRDGSRERAQVSGAPLVCSKPHPTCLLGIGGQELPGLLHPASRTFSFVLEFQFPTFLV